MKDVDSTQKLSEETSSGKEGQKLSFNKKLKVLWLGFCRRNTSSVEFGLYLFIFLVVCYLILAIFGVVSLKNTWAMIPTCILLFVVITIMLMRLVMMDDSEYIINMIKFFLFVFSVFIGFGVVVFFVYNSFIQMGLIKP